MHGYAFYYHKNIFKELLYIGYRIFISSHVGYSKPLLLISFIAFTE